MSRFPPTLLSLLGTLVRCPSVTPEGESVGTERSEQAMADLVAGHLRALGSDVSTVPLAPGRPNVIGVFEPVGRAAATVLIAPHLGTVSAGGMTVPPFKLTRRAGRLYGRGACDSKGPMAAALWALRRWSRSAAARRSRTRWIFAATAGEEPCSLGAQRLVRRGLLRGVDFAVALARRIHPRPGVGGRGRGLPPLLRGEQLAGCRRITAPLSSERSTTHFGSFALLRAFTFRCG